MRLVNELERENNRLVKFLKVQVGLLEKENQGIKDKAVALLHLPFSAIEAFEKARKELLEVITKTDPPCHYEERSDEVISRNKQGEIMKFKFKEGDTVKIISAIFYGMLVKIITQIRTEENHHYINQYVVEDSRGWRKTFYENHLKLFKEV